MPARADFTYYNDQELPVATFDLSELGEDFSTGWTFSVRLCRANAPTTTVLLKTTGITATATVVTVAWSTTDWSGLVAAVPPNGTDYVGYLYCRRTADSKDLERQAGRPFTLKLCAAAGTSAVSPGATTVTVLASTVAVSDVAGNFVGDDVEEVLAEQATKFAFRKSALLMPGAPFQRVIASSPPTVAVNASSTITSGRSFTATPTSKYMTLCAGGNFLTDGPRYSASHVYPRTFPGRKYFSTLVGFDGTDIEFQLDSAPGHYYRFSYREAGQNEWRYVAESEVAGPGGGAIRYFKLTFSAAATRVIRMENTAADIRSLTIGQYDTCWAVPPRGPRCIVVGDSYVQSASAPPTGYSSIGSWVTSFADTLGWDDVWNSGLGGTGYIADGSYVDFNARAADDIIAFAPEVVVVYGGRNDFASGAAAIGTAAGSLFTALRAGLPTAILVVVGPNGSGSPTDGSRDTSTWGPIEDAIFSATASTADIQLEMMSSGIFTGTGNVSSPATGNQTNYIQSDGVHPSTAGARYLGQRIAYKLLAALPNI